MCCIDAVIQQLIQIRKEGKRVDTLYAVIYLSIKSLFY